MSPMASIQVEYLAKKYKVFSALRRKKRVTRMHIMAQSGRTPANAAKKELFIQESYKPERPKYSIDTQPKKKKNKDTKRKHQDDPSSSITKQQQTKKKKNGIPSDGIMSGDIQPLKKLKHGEVVDSKEPIPQSNIGHIMLTKMGWGGGGLGADGQGTSAPIPVVMRRDRLGLGL
ncbi:hypothetical protein SAMD00019534_110480 [Acytostelium subglobosum LB1]|uniref:hypothetical protein n=1 Tax=Acytostelium subglobosum LB1 TaxID=1410327 RepID=UPI0006447F30|nr:hypothetical protein SAMD00019534_110480 [Acytostelium subglobosum LB1]GAM27872.1 hypothetical protein SAMD00019534_110480 [Acytostelium subglobosum LB1]|eukprot:XP_012749155.1 hypothetical protein SAMD00019534_110480 [Acytostelium subglobosum LB1]